MKFDNRKGNIIGVTFFILAFMLLITTYMFYSIFLYDIAQEEVIGPLTNITIDAGNITGISPQMIAAIRGYETSYGESEPAWDLFFMMTFGAFFIASMGISLMSRKESAIGFFGAITIGIMMFLLLFGFIDQITTFLFDTLIVGVLEFDLTTTPFLNFYFNNIEVLNIFWAFLLILINQFDIDIIGRKQGRVQA